MAGGGRKVRVSMSGDLGQLLQFAASPELERLGRAAAKAADGTEKMEQSAKKTEDEQEKRRQKAQDDVADGFRRVAIEGAAAGAVRALGQSGAGATDAIFAGIRGLQGALPALGETLGLANGLPPGAGTLAGAAGAAILERSFGPEAQSREEAIAAATAAFAPAAAQGVPITKEEYQEVFTQALLIASRQRENERGARSAAGAFP